MNEQKIWKIMALSVLFMLIAPQGAVVLFATASTGDTEWNEGKGNGRGGSRGGRGGIIYVDAENGDDDIGDGSEGNPYKTIGKGVSESSNGDTPFPMVL